MGVLHPQVHGGRRAGVIADQFAHRSNYSVRAIGARATPVGGLRRRSDLRDFVFIDDVVDAVIATVQIPATEPRCLDIGSGIATTIHELTRKIAAICDAAEPTVVPKFRDGDVRAASCTIEPAKNTLHWRPKWALEDGLHALLAWISEQPELPLEPSDHTHAPGRATVKHDAYR